MKKMYSRVGVVLLLVLLTGNLPVRAQEAGVTLSISTPVLRQVLQRDARDRAMLTIQGMVNAQVDSIEARVELVDGATRGKKADWIRIAGAVAPGAFTGKLPLQAGGWYKISVRAMKGKQVVAEESIDKVGVGEVFVTAGQSNSANFGDEHQRVKTGLVVNYNGANWQIANDPQPGADGGGGSFIPPFGDAIAERFKVPVGFVTCGIGATSVREWVPKGTTFTNPPYLKGRVTRLAQDSWACNGDAFSQFVNRMKQLGTNGFRAVLWHQGESDSNLARLDPKCPLSGADYARYLELIIRESRKEIGWNAPWFVAQVSYHWPGEESSDEIRAGQKMVWADKVALEGPDTDTLKSDFREMNGKGVHFTGKGLRAHGALWAEKVGAWLAQGCPVGRERKQK